MLNNLFSLGNHGYLQEKHLLSPLLFITKVFKGKGTAAGTTSSKLTIFWVVQKAKKKIKDQFWKRKLQKVQQMAELLKMITAEDVILVLSELYFEANQLQGSTCCHGFEYRLLPRSRRDFLSPQTSLSIFLWPVTTAHWTFPTFQTILCKPDRCLFIKIPSHQLFLKYTEQFIWHHSLFFCSPYWYSVWTSASGFQPIKISQCQNFIYSTPRAIWMRKTWCRAET